MTLFGQSDNLQYIFDLPKEINFYSDWKVGLTELNFSGNFYSDFSDRERTIKIKKKSDEVWNEVILPFIAYSSVETIIDQINEKFKREEGHLKDCVKVDFNKISKYLTFHVHKDFELKLSEKFNGI